MRPCRPGKPLPSTAVPGASRRTRPASSIRTVMGTPSTRRTPDGGAQHPTDDRLPPRGGHPMTTTPTRAEPDPAALEALAGRVIGDLGAAMHLPLVALGDRLGLFRAMAEAGPVTSAELAERTGCADRYLREWLSAQAAGGYVAYDPEGERFWVNPEEGVAFADEDSPFFLAGGSLVVT